MYTGKVKKYFKISGGNSGLTEEFIYHNQPQKVENTVKVYSSSTKEFTSMHNIDKGALIIKNGKEKKVKIFNREGIIITRNGGFAGTMYYANNSLITMNDHAYFLEVREEYIDKIDIKFILYTQKNAIEQCVSADNGGNNRTFSKTLYEQSIISIPDWNTQEKIVSEYEKLENYKEKLQTVIKKIEILMNKIPLCQHGDIKEVNDVFYVLSEDRRLTEEFIYNHQGKYPVYSAQVEGAFGYIDEYRYTDDIKDTKKVYYNSILLVVNYGQAGKTNLKSGKFSIGRNVCGLVPREEFIDKVDLKFMKYILESIFINNAKGKDLKSLSQGTIKKTQFFLPDYNSQVEIAKEYSKLEIMRTKTLDILEQINIVMNNQMDYKM